MNALNLWIHSLRAEALGWTLFHFLWEGAAIAGALVLLLAALKPARARYAAACAALLAMALAFGITLAVEWPWHPPQFTILTGAPAWNFTGAVFANGTGATPFRWSDAVTWAPALWLLGVVGLYLYHLGSWMAAQRLRRMGTCLAPEMWQRRVRELAAIAGVSRPVALLESCLAEVPLMIGYLKPAIVTPIGLLAGLPPEQVEAILLHELAHIRRADYLINLFQTAVEGLLFYHPAVWWVSGVMRAERENCCDDSVVALQGNVHQYAAALFTVERSRSRAPQSALAATGNNLARRIRRLLGQPESRDLSLPVLPSALLLVSVAVALAAWQPAPAARQVQKPVDVLLAAQPAAPEPASFAIVAAEPVRANEPDAPPEPPAAQQSARPQAAVQPAPLDVTYIIADEERSAFLHQQAVSPQSATGRWQFLSDTSFIITPEERTAYTKLQTSEEQDKFIEQFWARRNPTPGAPTNSFHDEFYRRLSYAASHFAVLGNRTGAYTAPGWAYIKYGPPDQIEDHTSDARNPSLFWRYNYLEAFHNKAEFQFVKVGENYRQQLNFPPPLAIFTGVRAAADDLVTALNNESRQGQSAAPAQAATTGLPGTHATISISPEKPMVILSVPLDGLSGRVDVIGQIRAVSSTGAPGATVASVRDYVQASGSGGTWQSNFTLAHGSYVGRVVVRENATGGIYTEEINFEVK